MTPRPTMALKLLILAIVSFGSVKTVLASNDCAEVNLYNREGPNHAPSPLTKLPIYDQGPLNVCYAYTASQMIDYYLMSNGKKALDAEPTNAHWIAFNHKTAKVFLRSHIQWSKKELGESFMRWAINDIRRNGSTCKDEIVKKSIEAMKTEFGLTDNEFLFLFEQIWNRFDKKSANDWAEAEKILAERGSLDPDKRIEVLLETFTEIDRQRQRRGCPEGNCAGGGTREENEPVRRSHMGNWLRAIKNIFKKVPKEKTDEEYLKYLRGSLFAECDKPENRIPIEVPVPRAAGGGWSSDGKIKRKIDRTLNDKTNPQPVGIGYCSDIYNHPTEWKGLRQQKWKPRILEIRSSGCNAHYSLLVGKKPGAEPGKCKYLIRNTMGEKILWGKGWECECMGSNGKTTPCSNEPALTEAQRNEVERKVVGCWVDEDVLAPNTFDVEHF